MTKDEALKIRHIIDNPNFHDSVEFRIKPQSKDEALKMAIEALETAEVQSEYDGLSDMIFKAINACKEALEQPTTQEPVAYCKEWEDKSGKHKDIKFEKTVGYIPLHPNQTTTQEPVDVEKIKKEAKQTLADLIEMNNTFAKTHGKPMYIHLWSLANGLTFDLREPNPETMLMEYYLGTIELNQHTELAFDTKQLDYNKLARS